MTDPTDNGEHPSTYQAWPSELADIDAVIEVGGVRVFTADSLVPWSVQSKEWRIREVMPKGGYGIVAAPKKGLKTETVSGQMALSVANDFPFLGDERFPVVSSCPVIVVINEGTQTYVHSLKRQASTYGRDSIGDIYVVPANGRKFDSPDLNNAIAAAILLTGAGVVIYDATFGFVRGDVKAESLFSMNDNLAPIKALHDQFGVDCWIIHHFNKGKKGDPDLSDAAWAGFDAWADQWILLTHRQTPRPDIGQFRLGMVVGFRGGKEWAFEIDVEMGRFDVDESRFVGDSTWTIEPVAWEDRTGWGKGEAKHANESARRKAAVQALVKDPWQFNTTDLRSEVGGRSKETSDLVKEQLAEGVFVEVSGVPSLDKNGHERKKKVLQISRSMRGQVVFGVQVPAEYPSPAAPPTHDELKALA